MIDGVTVLEYKPLRVVFKNHSQGIFFVAAPLVSAILTFSDARRLSLVRKVVNQFIRQHYTPYELVVVNGTDSRVLTNDSMENDSMQAAGCGLTEVYAASGLNSAAMKNHGLKVASGEWVICIDDDDYVHPGRLLYQMAHRRDGKACLLRHQLRVDVSAALTFMDDTVLTSFRPGLYLVNNPEGVPNTIIFPRLKPDGTVWQFNTEINTGEYEALLAEMRQCDIGFVICDNQHNVFITGMHWPLLSVAMYHGGNELTREQFFPDGNTVNMGQIPNGLNAQDMDCLKNILRAYNFSVQ